MDTGTETASPVTPRKEGEAPTAVLPEETFSYGSGSTSRETSSVIIRTPVQKTYSRKRNSAKRPTRKRAIISDSEEDDDEEEYVPEKKMVTRKKPVKRTNEQERRAKDGRRLVDLTNRIRDEKGRIRGYKSGTEPAKIQKKKPRMKMPSISPPLVTPELRIAVDRKSVV